MNPEETMRAMVFERQGEPLKARELPVPSPNPEQVLIKIEACGICSTDLHLVDNELPEPALPVIPGHEIVGTVVETGGDVTKLRAGDRVGVPWLGYTCGKCRYCMNGKENLCEQAGFTGYTLDGGFAEYTVAYQKYVFPLFSDLDPAEAAPLLCAGLIGYRSYRMAGEGGHNLGLYGFGAAVLLM